MLRGLLSQIERKVEEESAGRQRDISDLRKSMDQKLVSIAEKLKNDER